MLLCNHVARERQVPEGMANNMKRSVRKGADKKAVSTSMKLRIMALICLNFSFVLLYQTSYYLCHIRTYICAFGVWGGEVYI